MSLEKVLQMLPSGPLIACPGCGSYNVESKEGSGSKGSYQCTVCARTFAPEPAIFAYPVWLRVFLHLVGAMFIALFLFCLVAFIYLLREGRIESLLLGVMSAAMGGHGIYFRETHSTSLNRGTREF